MNRQSTKSAASTLQAEHQSLEREVADWRRWWAELCEMGQPHFGEMGDRLAHFREHLVSHFALEESQVKDAPADATYRLSQLRDEHAEMLAELDRLIDRLQARQPEFDCWGDARSDFESFLDRLHDHEEAERQLLQHADTDRT